MKLGLSTPPLVMSFFRSFPEPAYYSNCGILPALGIQELLSVITMYVADGIIPQFNIFFIWKIVISIVK